MADLDAVARDPDVLINGDAQAADLFLTMASSFFAAAKAAEFRPGSGGELDSLLCDASLSRWAVWEQIKLQSHAVLSAASHVDLRPAPRPAPDETRTGSEEESDSQLDDFLGEEEDAATADDDTKPIFARDFFASDGGGDSRRRRVREIEDRLVSTKPWHLSGETAACERAKDSLLDADLDFDFTSAGPPPAPATSDLEKILLGRIESMRFDDVVRKAKPEQSAAEAFEISTAKPRLGLADEYADLFAQREAAAPDQLTADQKTAIDLADALFRELDRFAERRFIARRPRDRVEVKQGVALDVDAQPEIAPRPEDALHRAGSTRAMKGDAEVTPQERKARIRVRKEKGKKQKEAEDAKKGVLYSQKGRDGAEVSAKRDVDMLLSKTLPAVEVVAPGGQVSEQRQTQKNVNRKFLR
jgi:U3 small nucleolar ribonucleoprotein component